MNQIARYDWLPERARWSHLARSALPAVSRKQNFPKSHIINPLLTKFVRSINTQKKELGQYPAILTSHLVNNPYSMNRTTTWLKGSRGPRTTKTNVPRDAEQSDCTREEEWPVFFRLSRQASITLILFKYFLVAFLPNSLNSGLLQISPEKRPVTVQNRECFLNYPACLFPQHWEYCSC